MTSEYNTNQQPTNKIILNINGDDSSKSEVDESAFDSEVEGVYIISQGQCSVINRRDNFEVWDIYQGACFGHGKLFKSYEYNHFGDIYAKTDVKILYLPHTEILKLPKDELSKLVKFFHNRNQDLEYYLCERFNLKFSELR